MNEENKTRFRDVLFSELAKERDEDPEELKQRFLEKILTGGTVDGRI